MNIKVEKKGCITTVILNRPKVCNAVDRSTANLLAQAFREFDADKEAKVAVFCGANSNFCAGADLKKIASGEPNRVELDGDAPMGPTRLILQKPVIAAISGYAVAGGLELALWCDLRIVEENAILGVFCRRWGGPLIGGGTVRLPRLIGLSRALDLILTGREVTALEALNIGLANRVVPVGQSRQVAEELALSLANFPQTCLKEDRLSAYEQFDLPLEQALKNELKHGLKSLEAEAVKGAKQFTQKTVNK